MELIEVKGPVKETRLEYPVFCENCGAEIRCPADLGGKWIEVTRRLAMVGLPDPMWNPRWEITATPHYLCRDCLEASDRELIDSGTLEIEEAFQSMAEGENETSAR